MKYTKAFTLSYDDGIFQDRRFVYLLNKYGLKCTFNLNSGLIQEGSEGNWSDERKMRYTNNLVPVCRMIGSGLPELYRGHEVAVHGVDHIKLTDADKKSTEHELIDDKIALSKMFGYDVVGAAYAYGASNEYAEEALKKAGIKYSRSIESTEKFDPSSDMYNYKPTCQHSNSNLFDLAKKFIELKTEKPQIFYVWGHTYEFDSDEKEWTRIEEFFKLISGHDDILYGTNIEVFKYFGLV